MEEPEKLEAIDIETDLVGLHDVPLMAANLFIAQVHQDEVILTIGQAAPPVVMGTSEEVREQLKQIDKVPARVVARLSLTPLRLRQLIGILQETVGKQEFLLSRLQTAQGDGQHEQP